jgi:ComF family protein
MGTISEPGAVRPGNRSAGRRAHPALWRAGAVLSALFLPPLCVHCGRDRWQGSPLCSACHRDLRPWRPEPGPVPGAEDPVAENEDDLHFLFGMVPPLSSLIHGFKYHHRRRHVRFLCAYLRYRPELTAWAKGFDALVPVPIHSVRKRERGYNQAEEIARAMSPFLGLPVLSGALRRPRPTRSQTRLGRDERRDNLADAFRCPHPEAVRGKRLLLIDDVYTTGATAGRCRERLSAAGAAGVGVLALARVEAASPGDDLAKEMEAVSCYAV